MLFVRAPRIGEVKTRLARDLGAQTALDLYKAFTEDMLKTIESVGAVVSVHFYPQRSRPEVIDWLGPSFDYRAQHGEGLGRRMENAFCNSFEAGHKRVLLVGSDLPDLPASVFKDGFGRLKTHDAVLGPASDGGYYLIGFSSETFLPEVFSQIAWAPAGCWRKHSGISADSALRFTSRPSGAILTT